MEGAITFGPGFLGYFPGMGSVSGSVTLQDCLNLVSEGKFKEPCAVKAGLGYGTPNVQGSVLLEWYVLLSGETREPIYDLGIKVEQKVQQIKAWGVQNILKRGKEVWPKLERELDGHYRKFVSEYSVFHASKSNESAKKLYFILKDMNLMRVKIYAEGVLGGGATTGSPPPTFDEEMERLKEYCGWK